MNATESTMMSLLLLSSTASTVTGFADMLPGRPVAHKITNTHTNIKTSCGVPGHRHACRAQKDADPCLLPR
ncbi:hypothetical protein HPP92_025100 [Vanilla planifolia]|uniref:Uncharacterized protein n=1 Tax=Vanilla planifolia TaxID=51239 RepID=A0A835PKB6_VANPL|nr:hypothetical protein HPP92_025374 [Vanilla planifolia]KAG0453796.1 hypothetical protein HPP92_025100 [Vanilla planifolia]